MSERLIVIGGGIAGLAAAHGARASKPAAELEIILLEASNVLGGKARTHREDGWLVEEGPTGYLDSEPVMDKLVALSGLKKRVANPAAARRFLVRDGVLREIRPHPLKFLTSGILSPLAAARIACEPFIPRRTDPSEESVFDFAARRLGKQAAERLIGPMVLGVFAGDAHRISLAAAFPRMAELENEYGSLVRALLSKRRKSSGGGPAGPGGALCSFDDGMQSFLTALGEQGEFECRLNSSVIELAHDGAQWRVSSKGQSLTADRVIVATEAWTATKLLRKLLPAACGALDELPAPHVAVCALGYGPEALAKAPRGFGALIQRGGGLRSLGVLWDTHLFAGRSPDGGLLMRVMVGGSTDPSAAQLTNDEISSLVEAEIAKLFGLQDRPRFRHIARWPRAIPQYEVGHLDLVRRVREDLARLESQTPGLQLAGNYLDGVALAKVAASGWLAGEACFTHSKSST